MKVNVLYLEFATCLEGSDLDPAAHQPNSAKMGLDFMVEQSIPSIISAEIANG